MIHSGLGGGNEIAGGCWVLFAGWSYSKSRIAIHKVVLLDRITFGICNIAGTAGLLSTIPSIAVLAQVVFGLSMIVWFTMLGGLLVSRSFNSVEV